MTTLGFFAVSLTALYQVGLEPHLQRAIAMAAFFAGFVLLALEVGIRQIEARHS